MSGLADPNGDYDIFIPLQAPSTDYSNQTMTIFDPETGNTLGSALVDLSTLTTSAPGQLPTIQGTCSDDDAGSPDGDDPDCD
jgi:hypothetical protein